jgi:hypothetical protein|tara:strand:- start:894 stop:1085 length:192 start_codon:yes stop_codon:yes gene_type:complete
MEIPDSPLQMQREWIIEKLDELPEGSVVTLPIEEYRAMVMRQLQLHDLIASQQRLLEEHVPDF